MLLLLLLLLLNEDLLLQKNLLLLLGTIEKLRLLNRRTRLKLLVEHWHLLLLRGLVQNRLLLNHLRLLDEHLLILVLLDEVLETYKIE